jgi:hypothetical protein
MADGILFDIYRRSHRNNSDCDSTTWSKFPRSMRIPLNSILRYAQRTNRGNIHKSYAASLLKNLQFFGPISVPYFLDWLRVDYTRMFALQAWFLFWVFSLEIPTGVVADKFGRKISVSLGWMLFASDMLFFGLSRNYYLLPWTTHSGCSAPCAWCLPPPQDSATGILKPLISQQSGLHENRVDPFHAKPLSAAFSRDKSEGLRIHAIAEMRRRRTIVEHMAQMGIAFSARNCRPDHAQAGVSRRSNVFRRDGRPETRPACPGVKLCIRIEQSIPAAYATIKAFFMLIPEFSREGNFSVGPTGDREGALRKLLSPFRFRFNNLRYGHFFNPFAGIGEFNNHGFLRRVHWHCLHNSWLSQRPQDHACGR